MTTKVSAMVSMVCLGALFYACSASDPESARLQECQARVGDLETRIQQLAARLEGVDATAARLADLTSSQEHAIVATKTDLRQKESDLKRREDALAKATEAARAATFGDGTWEVGRDIQPGKYRTENTLGACYWEKNTGGDGIDSIIGNDNAVGPTTVIISSNVPYFKSRGCGQWRKMP